MEKSSGEDTEYITLRKRYLECLVVGTVLCLMICLVFIYRRLNRLWLLGESQYQRSLRMEKLLGQALKAGRLQESESTIQQNYQPLSNLQTDSENQSNPLISESQAGMGREHLPEAG